MGFSEGLDGLAALVEAIAFFRYVLRPQRFVIGPVFGSALVAPFILGRFLMVLARGRKQF